ncbi:hypothetical protein CUN91_00575 [Candidatus Carsonella ruddii]|uniref:Elongation factor Ts n=1 Tax=Carsonella ruddii TaxID=114186 RepID=A0A2K8K4C8_CARRU|nr:hypothetical protein [Candidatus Carsonella ruddii]ATX33449.1 hypothetical protein CUN91_00575 [Candidatus Carsonella ruddii]
MLNINLILKIKKEYNFNIGSCKKLLENNNWDYKKTILYIKNSFKKINFTNFKYYSIINIEKKNKIFIIKICYNSTIIDNSTIIENFKKKLILIKIDIKILKNEINLLSFILKDKIFLNKFFIFINKNIFFYNHKNIFFCLINYKKLILNICCHIIFKKINFFNLNICKNNLMKQKYIKNETLFINDIIKNNFINYIFLINKNNIYFYYE